MRIGLYTVAPRATNRQNNIPTEYTYPLWHCFSVWRTYIHAQCI